MFNPTNPENSHFTVELISVKVLLNFIQNTNWPVEYTTDFVLYLIESQANDENWLKVLFIFIT